MSHAQTVRDYLAALGQLATGNDLARFFHPEVEQTEYPNRLVPNGMTRTLDTMLASAERGRAVTARQSYMITSLIEQGDIVAVEFDWAAALAIPIGTLAAGDSMTGKFVTVIEFRDGLIYRQRNYDCFDPF